MEKEKTKVSVGDFIQKYAIILIWILIIIIFGVLRPTTFLTVSNFATILSSKAVLVVLSLAVMIPLIAGDFDLSVASTLVLSNMAIAVLNARMGMPLILGLIVAILIGLIVGIINGFFAVKVGINPSEAF